ncbi:MAG: hypothetical protein KatS3mg053_2640 [Candidatus Roseilinea sp.]|nr:MAG: hypothetical protein KatS3mg053_2640 [Candidatus Roseilinea sp.]
MNMPEMLDPFDPALGGALDKLAYIPPRDPQAVERGRTAFLAYAQAARATQTPAKRTPVRPKRRLLRLSLAAISAFIFGSAAVTLAAQASQPNDVLYPVKLLSEEARLALAFGERAQLDLLIEFSNRRLDELQATASDQAASRSVILRLEKQVNQAAEIAARIGDTDADATTSLQQLQDLAERARRAIRQPENTPVPQPTAPAPVPSATPASPTPSATPLPTLTAPEPTAEPPAIVTPLPPEPPLPPTAEPTVDRPTAIPTPPRPRPRQPDPGAPVTLIPLPLPTTPEAPPKPPELRETVESIRATARAEPRPNPDDVRATMQAIRETAAAMRPTAAPPPAPAPPPPPGSEAPPAPLPQPPEGGAPPRERRPRPTPMP